MGKETSKRWPLRFFGLLIAFITFVIFAQVIISNFTNYDDPTYITENPQVRAGLNIHSIKWAFSSFYAANWHPLTWLSHMLDWQIFGAKPSGHHLMSLLLHIVNSVLLLLLLNRMTGSLRRSAFVAVLFAIHPLHVESVVWIAERKDVLSTFFLILTMLAYVQYAHRRSPFRYAAVILAYILGLLAKPMLVTLPLILLMLDYWPLAQFKMRCVWEKLPLFALAFASCIVTFFAQRNGGAVNTLEGIPVSYRLSNAIVSYAIYLRKMFWPNDLAVYYPHPGNLTPLWQVVFSGLLIICISAVVISKARKFPCLAVGWMWYLVTLIPVIGLMQVGSQAMADRYTYIPLIGIFIMLTWGVADFIVSHAIGYRAMSAVGYACAGLVIIALGICTWNQVGYWRNSYTLFQHAAQITRDNIIVDNNLGMALAERGKFKQAVEYYHRALKLKPGDAKAHINLAIAFTAQKKYTAAESEFKAAIKSDSKEPNTYYNLGNLYSMQGKIGKAVECYSKSLQINPRFIEAQINIGNSLVLQNKFHEAIDHYNLALQIDPNSSQAHYCLADALTAIGDKDEAVKHYCRTLRTNPDSSNAHLHLALVLDDLGQVDQAVEHYRCSLRIKPKRPDAANNLAWILATNPDGKIRNPSEAIRLAEIACKKTKNLRPDFLDTLAASYASAGKYNKAAYIASKALSIASSAKQPALAKDIQQKLRLYLAGKPYICNAMLMDNVRI